MEQRSDSSQLSSEPPKPRLKERFHEAIRTRGYSQRTAKSYWFWIRWFIRHHGRRHPAELGAAEVELTADDLREIDAAASRIEVHGARYPEASAWVRGSGWSMPADAPCTAGAGQAGTPPGGVPRDTSRRCPTQGPQQSET